MPQSRYYLNTPLTPQNSYTLTGSEHHHLYRVMRAKPFDPIELINGKGVLGLGSIESIDNKKAVINLSKTQKEASPSYTMILCQAIIRPARLNTIIEKGCELGVTAFWLFRSDHSQNQISQSQLNHLEKTLIAAMKQSGRLYLPPIETHSDLFQKPPAYPLFFGDLKACKRPLMNCSFEQSQAIIAIGPEGGFSHKENEFLNKYGTGFWLSDNILRSDTAAIVSLGTIAQHLCQKPHA